MNISRPIPVLLCFLLASCQTGTDTVGVSRLRDVMGVDEFQRTRHLLDHRMVRIDGFLMSGNRTFFLTDGRPRSGVHTAEDRRYRSWCLVPSAERPLWLVARNGAHRWGSVRLDEVTVGVHVIVEGRVEMDGLGPGEIEDAFEIGPLYHPRIIDVLGDRCAGSSPDFGLRGNYGDTIPN